MAKKNRLPDTRGQAQLRQVAQALVKDIKTESDLNKVLNELVKMTLETPRDRNGEFAPIIVKKGQTRLTHFDDQILAFYAQGMTTRERTETFKKISDAEVLPSLISKVTDAVIDQVTTWRNRPLDNRYPIVYIDCIVVKVHQGACSTPRGEYSGYLPCFKACRISL